MILGQKFLQGLMIKEGYPEVGYPYSRIRPRKGGYYCIPFVPYYVYKTLSDLTKLKKRGLISSIYSIKDEEEIKSIKETLVKIVKLYDFNNKLKNGEIEPLKYEYKEPEPYPHQKIGTSLLLVNPFYALFCEQGTGKTRMAIDAVANLFLKKKLSKIFVVAPLSVLEAGWVGDLKKFCVAPYRTFLAIGNREQKIEVIKNWISTPKDALNVLLMGYDFLWRLYPPLMTAKDLEKVFEDEVFLRNFLKACKKATKDKKFRGKFKERILLLSKQAIGKKREIFLSALLFLEILDEVDVIIADESQKIKTFSAKRTKAFLNVAFNAKRKYLLSGTPITNNPIDIYAQTIFLHPLFFASKQAFKNYFMDYEKKDKYEKIVGLRKGVEKEFKSLLNSFSYIVKKDDVLKNLPDKIFLVRDVFLSERTTRLYLKLRDQFAIEAEEFIEKVDKGEIPEQEIAVYAQNFLARMQKLLQITSGFVRESGEEGNCLEVGNEKLDTLLEVIEEIGKGESVVIWANYRYEIERKIVPTLRKKGYSVESITGATPQKQRGKIVNDFQEGKFQILVANPATLATGVTLTRASNAIYYSLSFKLEDFLQSQDRLHRIGQRKSVNYYLLLSVLNLDDNTEKYATMDRIVCDNLLKKKKMTDNIVKFIKETLQRLSLSDKD